MLASPRTQKFRKFFGQSLITSLYLIVKTTDNKKGGNMKSWQQVFRKAIVPNLSKTQLQTLYKGLLNDDPRLIQGATTRPPPLACVSSWNAEGAWRMPLTRDIQIKQ